MPSTFSINPFARRTPVPRKPATLPVLLLLAIAVAPGCAQTTAGGSPVSYGDSARVTYEKGMTELKDENHLEAVKYFAFVRNKFPFSRYATLAELRMADTFFAQEKYLESIDAYKMFIKFHPTHPQVVDGYAAYRVSQSYMKQIPGDWFLVPPSYEKDQSATREAVRELKIFLRSYPDSKYLPEVKKLHRAAVRKLTDHELYVARFYLERDQPKATILRLEGVLQKYPEAGVLPEVMLLLGQTYLKLEQRKKAVETFRALVDKHPKEPHAAKAKLYLDYLTRRN